MNNKKGQVWETIPPWVIVVIFLVIMLIVYGIISGKLGSVGEFLENLFRFGR